MLPTDPSGDQAPGFDAPLDMLHACHDKVRRFAGHLEQLPDYLARHVLGAGARNTIAGVLRYFDVAGPLHHQDEERDLFPLLVRRDPGLASEVARLAGEHIELGALWAQLRLQLQALADGDLNALDPQLARDFATRYREHAAREEAGVFARAVELLAPDELARIGIPMQARRRS